MGNGLFYRVGAGYSLHITCAGEQSRIFHFCRPPCRYSDQCLDDPHKYQKHDRISSSPSICSVYGRIFQRYVILPADHGAKNDVSAIGFHLPLISLSLFIYAASIFLVIQYYLAVFPDPKRGKRETAAPTGMLLAAVPAAGYMISHAVLRVSESAVYLLMSIVYLLMACLFSIMGVKFIHKYFFIKANQDIIRQHRI